MSCSQFRGRRLETNQIAAGAAPRDPIGQNRRGMSDHDSSGRPVDGSPRWRLNRPCLPERRGAAGIQLYIQRTARYEELLDAANRMNWQFLARGSTYSNQTELIGTIVLEIARKRPRLRGDHDPVRRFDLTGIPVDERGAWRAIGELDPDRHRRLVPIVPDAVLLQLRNDRDVFSLKSSVATPRANAKSLVAPCSMRTSICASAARSTSMESVPVLTINRDGDASRRDMEAPGSNSKRSIVHCTNRPGR